MLTLTPIQSLFSALLTALAVHFLSLHFKKNIENNCFVFETSNDKTDMHSFQPLPLPLNLNMKLDKELPLTLHGPYFCLASSEHSNNKIYDNSDDTDDNRDNYDDNRYHQDSESKTLDNLLDAIFVSHGTENAVKTIEKLSDSDIVYSKTIPLALNDSNFDLVLVGDWLILAYVPWDPYSNLNAKTNNNNSFRDYFDTNFNEILSKLSSKKNSPTIKLATLNAQEYPQHAATLQINQYPSLNLVTDSGRLRQWPFPLIISDHYPQQMQTIIQFLLHRQWQHLPFYHQLKTSKNSSHLVTFQVKTFNLLASFFFYFQLKIFNWIQKHRPLTTGILGGASLLCLVAKRLNY